MKYRLLPIFFLFSFQIVAFGQETSVSDSVTILDRNNVIAGDDVTEIITDTPRNRPNKAALYSALLPGLGQMYNKKPWKVPIIYGGFMGLASGISDYHKQYKYYLEALKAVTDDDDDTENPTQFNEAQVRSRVDFYRRNRDFFGILVGFLYVLNIVDAHVDAHLKDFEVNDNLALSIKPGTINNQWNIPNAGIVIQLKVRP